MIDHTPRDVSNEGVAAYQGMVINLAWRYNGHCGAEFDDLFQEGMEVVFRCLRRNLFPSKDHVAHRMRRWVSKCRQQGLAGYVEYDPEEDLNALYAEEG